MPHPAAFGEARARSSALCFRSSAGDVEKYLVEVASKLMAGGVRFDDLAPEERVAFLDEARRHLELDPSSADLGAEWADLAPVWGCKWCGSEHPIDDMIVVKGEPRCPHCNAEGWQYVIPRARK